MKKIATIITLLIVLLASGIGWYVLNYTPPETIRPTRSTVIQAVYATGEVEPVYWSKIATQIAGKVEAVLVEESDVVTEGQPLLKLDDLVECTKASEYLAHLHYLEKEKERYQALSSKDFVSKSKYERIVSEYQATKAQLDAQNEVVARMLIKSPLDGVILKRDVEPGETITLSDTVFWVGKLTPLRVIAEVDEEDIALVEVGQKALIKADAFPETLIEGTIHDITPKGDPVDKNFRVRISLPDDTPLRIGMTVEINIVADTIEDALIIPVSSIIDDTVWVKDGRKFKERTIKAGIRDEQQIQVLDGLVETDVIALDPTALHKP